MKTKWLGILAAVCLTMSVPMQGSATAATTAAPLRDITGHWAQKWIQSASTAGWVSGFEDGTFRPEKTVTRAEFVKMLTVATGLTEDTAMGKFLMGQEAWPRRGSFYRDVRSHWVYTKGYFKMANAFGYIVDNDYAEWQFQPDRPITRQEIAVMVDRALGLVYSALYEQTGNVPFTDFNKVPDWLKGYVEQAHKAGVLSGYPDGTVGTNRTATRAEAVALIQRVVDTMRTGADPQIKLMIQKTKDVDPNDQPRNVPLSVPVQVIAGQYYVPLRDFYSASYRLFRDEELSFFWRVEDQTMLFEQGYHHEMEAGNETYLTLLAREENGFPAKPRLFNGELMIPVFGVKGKASQEIINPVYDANSKTLTIQVAKMYDYRRD